MCGNLARLIESTYSRNFRGSFTQPIFHETWGRSRTRIVDCFRPKSCFAKQDHKTYTETGVDNKEQYSLTFAGSVSGTTISYLSIRNVPEEVE
jgi:hypothetical protein